MPANRQARNTRPDIARAAAAEARALRIANGDPGVAGRSAPNLFTVRDGAVAAFHRGIPRLGATVPSRSEMPCADAAAAEHDGEDALAPWLAVRAQAVPRPTAARP